ncbi:AI-2E family transporter [Candidatus Pacearchaeota archaeon]|nr:AI-2E family transporter [Candidatus Pacearchaeota archaeon]
MIDESVIKQIIAFGFIAVLIVFTYFIIKPIFMSIILGLILAYTFNPLNKILIKYIKNKTLSASIICALIIGILILSIWWMIPKLVDQVFGVYSSVQSFDIVKAIDEFAPFLATSPQSKANLVALYSTVISSLTKSTLDGIVGMAVNFPSLMLEILTIFIIFFYGLRDGEAITALLKNSLPFKPSTTSKFIEKSKKVTYSIIFGRIMIGIIIGILMGIGLYIAKVPNAVLLMFISAIASIIPIIGPWVVWIPLVVGMFITGKIGIAMFLLIYCGIFVNLTEHLLYPLIISKQSQIPTSLTLIGLIGGMLGFGLIGIIIGPLVIAYLMVLFELYLEYNSSKAGQKA